MMFVIEFFADKIPAFDLIWNALHTFVRVPLAGLLAYAATPQHQATQSLLGLPTNRSADCFGVRPPVDKDVVRRVLAAHYQPKPDAGGPSWLTFLVHIKDSLWSADLFRCESAVLRTHWIPVVMDQYTCRIIGFGLHAGAVDGIALCRMFNHAIRGHRSTPKYLRSDNDPIYGFHQWQANLRILDVAEIKTVPTFPCPIHLWSG